MALSGPTGPTSYIGSARGPISGDSYSPARIHLYIAGLLKKAEIKELLEIRVAFGNARRLSNGRFAIFM